VQWTSVAGPVATGLALGDAELGGADAEVAALEVEL
jgi:hypothetical protein